jgi:hypothetical protein
MVYCHISEDIKNHILFLLDNGDFFQMNMMLRRSSESPREALVVGGQTSSIMVPLFLLPHILNADQTHDLFTLLQEAPEMYLDEIQELSISKTALHVLIRDVGISYKVLRKATYERDEVAREEFRQISRGNLVASMIITVDESSKDGHTIFWKRGRAYKGHCATTDVDFV